MGRKASRRNESTVSFSWLSRALGLSPDSRPSPAVKAWHDVRDSMRQVGMQRVVQMVDWSSDPWLALGATKSPFGLVAGAWSPPDRMDEWPDFGVEKVVQLTTLDTRRGRHQPFADLLAGADGVEADDGAAALEQFREREAAIQRHGDVHMVQGEYVRAWLFTAVGSLLDAVMLEPQTDTDMLTEVTRARLRLPLRFQLPPGSDGYGIFESRYLDLLYNLAVAPSGELADLDPSNIRTGQSEQWREHWAWLSQEIDADEAVDALHLAARLMRCQPLLDGVLDALTARDAPLKTMAVAVLRRWVLTLEAMAWLEQALEAPWTDVRPKDLACFAYNALKPDWPRRVVAISHRSKDVKPSLLNTRMWSSSRCAIDARYVPSWETNTAMVWGLFAATPAVARVHSRHYGESVWCRREAELTEYLLDGADFLSRRLVVDVDVSDLAVLDRVTDAWDGEATWSAGESWTDREFPPLVEVVTPSPMPEWELAMWRAAAALRAVNALVRDADATNELAVALLEGAELPPPVPTNNPGGWRDYAAAFEEAQSIADARSRKLAIRLPPSYGEEDRQRDVELLLRVPDLSTGTPALADVLVALEWLRTEWPIMASERRTNFVAVNARGLSHELWTDHPQLSLQRGLVAVRLPVPLWIIQTAEQGIEEWGVTGELPIFTEHVETQFTWMLPISPDRAQAQALFPEDSGLTFSRALKKHCQRGG